MLVYRLFYKQLAEFLEHASSLNVYPLSLAGAPMAGCGIVLFLACSSGPGMSRLRAGLADAYSWTLHAFNVGLDLVVLLQGCVVGVFRLAVIKLGACLFE